MINKTNNILDKVDKSKGLTTPDNYFENFTKEFIDNLPDTELPSTEPVSRWKRVQPWLYMAAMFVGIALMFKIFTINETAITTAEGNEIESEVEEIFLYENMDNYTLYEYLSENY